MSTGHLPADSWQVESSSVVDPVGRVIHYDGRVLRGIRAPYVNDVTRMLAVAETERWFDHGLVPTWATSLSADEYPLILEHQRVPFVTLRGEWPAEALRQGALCYLRLSVALAASGYCLKDAHSWNVLFAGPQPLVTDVGSIRPLGELQWPSWIAEFEKYFLAPLWLFAAGKAGLARALLREQVVGAGNWLFDHERNVLLGERRVRPGGDVFTPGAFERLAREVDDLRFPHPGGEWSTYAQPEAQSARTEWREKDRIVASVLDRLNFSTAIDLGANRGLHAFMCADRRASVLAADVDEICLDTLFRQSRSRTADVLPVYADLVWPIGSGGAFGTIPSAHDRLRCDLVLALALVHHICVRRRFDPDAFVAAVAAFTRGAALVEFIPVEDWHVQQWGLPPLAGYELELFHRSLARRFRRVTPLPSDPAPRVMFLCEDRR